MTDHTPFDDHDDPHGDDPDEPMSDADVAALGALLGDEAIWEEPSPGLEDAVVAAIRSEAEQTTTVGPEPVPDIGSAQLHSRGPALADLSTPIVADRPTQVEPPAGDTPVRDATETVVPFERPRRRWVGPLLGAAAALIAVAAFAFGTRLTETDPEPDYLIAMTATELTPGASAVADVVATPLGTRIILDVSGLPPAPDGQYYEAWLRQSPEIGVSAGTFHLRGGDGAIELWAGVTMEAYPLITVTLQDEGGGAASSGRVVLRGSIDG